MKIRSSSLHAFVATVAFSVRALAQQSPTLTEESYSHARQVLERGVAALGGQKNFQAVADIRFVSTAKVAEAGQSASPEAAYYLRPLEGEGVIDLLHKRYAVIRKTNYLGSGSRPSSVVTTEKTGFAADLRSNAVYPLAAPAVSANNKTLLRTFPYLLAQLAMSRAGTLRSLGYAIYDGHKQEVVNFVDADANQYTLYFDSTTALLTKTEGLSDGLLTGLKATETVYSDYRPVDGISMPFHVVSRLGGDVTQDLTYTEIAFNTHPDASMFDMPKDAELGPQIGGPRQPITLTSLGKDVYYVDAIEAGGIFFYSSLFVVFKDYVLVVEAPLNDNVAQAIIAKIKETAPGKPIRYLVPTHYHIDHSGGVRGYIAEGSTVVTTIGNRKFFETVAATAHPLNPDRLSLQPRSISVETFTGKRVFTDGDHVVELYQIGPSPHVDEMVIVYLPREKLAFVSDLFLVSYKGRIGAAEPINVYFDEKIRELGLKIETIAGGHGRIATMDELKQSLAERTAESARPTTSQAPSDTTMAAYHLTIPAATTQEIQVDAWIPVRDGGFFMDSIQAQQLPRGWATFVRHLSVTDSAGRSVPFDTIAATAAWALKSSYRGMLHLQYGVDLGYTRGTWPTGPKQSGLAVDSTLYTVTKALFIASNALGRSRVSFSLPRGWRLSVPWDPVSGSANTYVVDDGTDLLRNTFVVGHHAAYTIHEGKFTLLVALPGQMRAAGPAIEDAARKIIHEYLQVFPRTPPSRLLVSFFYAGVEDGEAFRKSATFTTGDSVTPNSRVIWVNFLAHEMFHHWNGQAIRGIERNPRQYFNEGFTEYYANRTIARTGLIAPALFLQRVQIHVGHYAYFRWAPPFAGVSLQDAGNDKTKYRFGVYDGGWTLALCLDGAIREQTHDRKSLDDVMRRMYDLFGLTDTPYRTSDIARVVSEVSGTDYSDFFGRYVAGAEPLPVRECLHRMGLEAFGMPYSAEYFAFVSATATAAEVQRQRSLMGAPW